MRFVFIIASLALTTGTIVIIWWAAFLNTEHKGYMTTGTYIVTYLIGLPSPLDKFDISASVFSPRFVFAVVYFILQAA